MQYFLVADMLFCFACLFDVILIKQLVPMTHETFTNSCAVTIDDNTWF